MSSFLILFLGIVDGPDGTVLTFEPALEYEHISTTEAFDGVVLETRAEVGVLTRNVVFRGSVNSDWTDKIAACDEKEFDTGKRAVYVS